ncbi:MAG: prepilin peptidase [Gemmatimonadaceae bacterium]
MISYLQGASAFVIGACIGSFLNVCIARWPKDESVIAPRSRCPRCGRGITAAENIPIVGWLLLRGRCRGCGGSISLLYPGVELTVALIWLAAAMTFGFGFTALRVAIFGSMLFGIAVTDAKHYVIPDGFTVFGLIWVALTATAALFLRDVSPFAEFTDMLLGACVGAGAVAIAGWLGELAFGKEAMGFGDVTLMAVVGAAVGPWRALLTIFVGALIGAIGFLAIVYPIVAIRSRRRSGEFEPPLVPFGVFLAPAAMVTLLWGRELIDWYQRRILAP